MKNLLLVCLMLAAVSVQAGEARFTVDSIANFGDRVYYNCDTVEVKTKSILKELGASNIKVRCTGGITRFGMALPARVRASFDTTETGTNETQTLSIKERDNCHLNTSIFNGVKRSFNITNVTTRRCFRSDDRTNITFDILR